jgi:hypothetical protein
MASQNSQSNRHEERNPLRFFVKLRILEDKKNQENKKEELVDALVSDSSENGAGVFTYSPLPIGTKVEVMMDDKSSIVGEVVNRDYLFPDDGDIIRLGIHYL